MCFLSVLPGKEHFGNSGTVSVKQENNEDFTKVFETEFIFSCQRKDFKNLVYSFRLRYTSWNKCDSKISCEREQTFLQTTSLLLK